MGERAPQQRTVRLDGLEVRLDEGFVRAGEEVLTLSVREFQLLVALIARSGGIVSRAELCREVWGHELRSGDRSVDVYVSKLRSKLERALPGQRFIHTHPGFGYRFASDNGGPPRARDEARTTRASARTRGQV